MKDLLDYDGKTVVVTGAAGIGMGGTAAAILVELGANVYALDVKEITASVKKYIKTDLGKKEEIEAAVKQIPAEIDCLFNCAGLPGRPFPNFDTTLVNFIGHRHLTELLIPRIKPGGAIAIITSMAGRGWQSRFEIIKELLAITDWDQSYAWLEAHEDVNDGYKFSKECLIAYTKWRALELAERSIRINCINPGPTATPMYTDYFDKFVPKERLKDSQGLVGRDARPEEMAKPLLFLNSNMASYISGVDLCVDYGNKAAMDIRA
ncbi:MAG: coniferyl-alcohol dehydrogenase [Dehalococcoidales bacterium]|nr:coniferyl-alcohol dehydrogenase [Dehalococcoidales bacterium]